MSSQNNLCEKKNVLFSFNQFYEERKILFRNKSLFLLGEIFFLNLFPEFFIFLFHKIFFFSSS